MSRSRPSLLLLTTLLLAAVAGAACSGSGTKAALPSAGGEARVGVRVVAPQATIDQQLVRATGSLVPRNEALVSAKIGGSIVELLADVGDRVKKDQPLARLDSANAAIGVEQAKAAKAVADAGLQSATQEYERAQKLRDSGGVSQAMLDRAEAGYKQAKAGAKQAEAGLQAAQRAYYDHTVRAPFDGLVTARLQNVGEFVTNMPAAPIFSLVDVDNLEVVLPVPETVIATIQPGATVRGIVNPSGKPFEAKVRVVGSVVNRQNRTVEVRADLEGERSAEMRPHAIVEVDFSQDEALAGLFLPTQAVVKAGDERFVWVVEEGRLKKTPVQAEGLSPGIVRILDGLSGDEQVVGDGSSNLAEGMNVQVIR